MFRRFLFIFSIVFVNLTYGAMNVNNLARCIMSGASIGTRSEQIATGFVCQRNSNHASNQSPTRAIIQLAQDILAGKVNDPTRGATNWYSPRSMPKDHQKLRCKSPIGKGHMDCDGGLESVCPGSKNYRPKWAMHSKQIEISGVRNCYYKFFKL